MTDHPRFLLAESRDKDGRRDIPYWSTRERIDQNDLFDIYEARPRFPEAGNHDYLLVIPREGLDDVRQQVSICRIAGRSAAANQLSHPAILPLVDAELDRPPFFWVEPRLRFPNLVQLLSGFQMTVSSAIWIVRQISQAILVAHESLRTLSALEPSQIHVSATGRVIVGGLDVSVPFGQKIDAVFTGWNVSPGQCHDGELMSGPEVDLANFGRLIQWMIDCTQAETESSQFVRRLSRLAAQAMEARTSHYSEARALTGRLLDCIVNLELDNLANNQPFGQVA